MTAAHITADELLQKLELGDDFVLVDALAPMVYAHSHLPTAINLPPLAVDAIRCAKRMPDLGTEIVVYCANAECDDSTETARRLEELGSVGSRSSVRQAVCAQR